MVDFQTSTHRVRWIFTEQNLLEKHEIANRRAAEMLEQYGLTCLEVDIDGSLSYPESLQDRKDNAERHSLPKPLNCEEEQLMRVFYEQKIQEVEENHVELGKGIQQDPQMILNNEMIVLQSLGFDLVVYAPYRSIEGFVEDMKEFFQATNNWQEKLMGLQEAAKSEVDRIMLPDAPLLFSPGQLALTALHRPNEVLRVLDFERYLESIVSQQRGQIISELAQTMRDVDFLVGKLEIPTAKDTRHIDRKLKSCCDPSSQNDSKRREKRSKHRSKRTASEKHEGPA